MDKNVFISSMKNFSNTRFLFKKPDKTRATISTAKLYEPRLASGVQDHWRPVQRTDKFGGQGARDQLLPADVSPNQRVLRKRPPRH